MQRKHIPGIEPRKSKSGKVTYRAIAFDARTGRKLSKSFPTQTAARRWKIDAEAAIRAGTLAPASALTFSEAADELLDGIEAGSIMTRAGKPYKPSAIRSYRRAIDNRLRPEFGPRKLAELRRGELQRFVDRMASDGLGASTIRNTLDPLRVIFRRAVVREVVTDNPTKYLEVPAANGKRDRIASPAEAAELIAALPADDRALWATAMYAGLRRGELRGLRWGDLDLATGVIRVQRGWDDVEGAIDGKTAAARRTVPITAPLRDALVEHRMLRDQPPPDALVFARDDGQAFTPSTIGNRAKSVWKTAELAPITLHEARHTFASTCIAAGVNAKALSTYMGHSNIAITFDLYGHLMPGDEAEATDLLDAYLLRSAVGKSWGSPAPESADLSGPERNGEDAGIPVAMREGA